MYRNWVEISLERLAANYRSLARAAGPQVTLAPVVKADAYHHGAPQVALRLQSEGADWFAVSAVEEGVELRQAGVTSRILVMGGVLGFELDSLGAHNLTPVIHSLAQLREFDRLAQRLARPLPYHLKLDSGMARLGCRDSLASLVDAVTGCAAARLEGLTTHFASASDFASPQTEQQIRTFSELKAGLAAAGITPERVHLSSSAPLAYDIRHALANMVRPGLSLYGYVPEAAGAAPPAVVELQPVLEWKARVVEVRPLPAGTAVGYGARWRAERPSRVAVVAAGYADGLPHQLSCRGSAIVNGQLAPYVGAVSMDLITLDVTDCGPLERGDAVTLLGNHGSVRYTAEEMAKAAGVIPYAILCSIGGRRVTRVYC